MPEREIVIKTRLDPAGLDDFKRRLEELRNLAQQVSGHLGPAPTGGAGAQAAVGVSFTPANSAAEAGAQVAATVDQASKRRTDAHNVIVGTTNTAIPEIPKPLIPGITPPGPTTPARRMPKTPYDLSTPAGLIDYEQQVVLPDLPLIRELTQVAGGGKTLSRNLQRVSQATAPTPAAVQIPKTLTNIHGKQNKWTTATPGTSEYITDAFLAAGHPDVFNKMNPYQQQEYKAAMSSWLSGDTEAPQAWYQEFAAPGAPQQVGGAGNGRVGGYLGTLGAAALGAARKYVPFLTAAGGISYAYSQAQQGWTDWQSSAAQFSSISHSLGQAGSAVEAFREQVTTTGASLAMSLSDTAQAAQLVTQSLGGQMTTSGLAGIISQVGGMSLGMGMTPSQSAQILAGARNVGLNAGAFQWTLANASVAGNMAGRQGVLASSILGAIAQQGPAAGTTQAVNPAALTSVLTSMAGTGNPWLQGQNAVSVLGQMNSGLMSSPTSQMFTQAAVEQAMGGKLPSGLGYVDLLMNLQAGGVNAAIPGTRGEPLGQAMAKYAMQQSGGDQQQAALIFRAMNPNLSLPRATQMLKQYLNYESLNVPKMPKGTSSEAEQAMARIAGAGSISALHHAVSQLRGAPALQGTLAQQRTQAEAFLRQNPGSALSESQALQVEQQQARTNISDIGRLVGPVAQAFLYPAAHLGPAGAFGETALLAGGGSYLASRAAKGILGWMGKGLRGAGGAAPVATDAAAASSSEDAVNVARIFAREPSLLGKMGTALKGILPAAEDVSRYAGPVGIAASLALSVPGVVSAIKTHQGSKIGSAVGGAAGGAAGAWGGAEAGAAIGTLIAPGVGTLIGGGIGALAGGLLGSKILGGLGGDIGSLFGGPHAAHHVAQAQLASAMQGPAHLQKATQTMTIHTMNIDTLAIGRLSMPFNLGQGGANSLASLDFTGHAGAQMKPTAAAAAQAAQAAPPDTSSGYQQAATYNHIPVTDKVLASAAKKSGLYGQEVTPWLGAIQKAHAKYPNVPESLIEAEIIHESNGKVGPTAGHIMGLLTSTQQYYNSHGVPGFNLNPSNPNDNVMMGTALLSMILKRYGGNEATALSVYGFGNTHVNSNWGYIGESLSIQQSMQKALEQAAETIGQSVGKHVAKNLQHDSGPVWHADPHRVAGRH